MSMRRALAAIAHVTGYIPSTWAESITKPRNLGKHEKSDELELTSFGIHARIVGLHSPHPFRVFVPFELS